VSLTRTDPSVFDGTDEPATMTPEEEEQLQARLDAVAEEKRLARLAPGPSWRDWFLYDASRWWIGLALLIVDSWIVVGWLPTGDLLALGVSLVGAIYLEYLLGQYLWHRPGELPTRRSGVFRPTWVHPFPYGRWTPEAVAVRAHGPSVLGDGSPDPKEFL
jgi:hypothetical protein